MSVSSISLYAIGSSPARPIITFGPDFRSVRGGVNRRARPAVAPLEKYDAARGGSPAARGALVPDALSAPPGDVNAYPLDYHAAAGSYTLAFSYTGPGMNHFVYAPATQWHCSGYY